jgi:hypothetical protein
MCQPHCTGSHPAEHSLPLMQWCFATLPQSSSSYQSDSNHQPRRSDTIRGCILSQSIETIAVGLFRSAVLACSLFAYTWDFQPRRTKPYAREQPRVARHVREINPRTTIVLPTTALGSEQTLLLPRFHNRRRSIPYSHTSLHNVNTTTADVTEQIMSSSRCTWVNVIQLANG